MRDWLSANWFNLIQSIGILAGLLFTSYTLWLTVKTQRITNLFQVTQFHREIWSLLFERPELHRVKANNVDLDDQPISSEERLFVSLLILHLSSTYQAIKAGAIAPIEAIERDVSTFFSLPIPQRIWHQAEEYQNKDFVQFVENCLLSTQADLKRQQKQSPSLPARSANVTTVKAQHDTLHDPKGT